MKRISLFFILFCSITLGSVAFAADVPRMSTDQLKASLNDSDVVILDARGSWDWTKTDEKIAGAIRIDPRSSSVWSKNYDKRKTIVLYCAWGNEHTSASVARKMIGFGFEKVYALKGGWNEWKSKGYPVEPK